ncbi:RidA family protein [Pendulispora albinea]|uniref:RidA family protein n=1 Tax=Pendulispora albinea TaxID=2741071 RepID=A0ABZ2LVU0_9BACT
MRKIATLAFAAALAGCGAAPRAGAEAPQGAAPRTGAEAPVLRHVNPSTLPAPRGYSHVVEARRGRSIYISGQIALDRSGKLVGAGDFRAQTEQVFTNLRAALAAVGADFTHVVKLNFYVTELDDAHLGALREVRDRYIDPTHPPASSLVQVVRLVRPELVVEIDAIAVVAD